MAKPSDISRETVGTVSDHSDGRYTVLYEEMAEYYYKFVRPQHLKTSRLDDEINYHLYNLLLLTFYFHTVFIQTATIFNCKNPYVQKIIEGVISSDKFKSMLKSGMVKIVGWGGNNPSEMHKAAEDFAKSANQDEPLKRDWNVTKNIFRHNTVISRSENTPDAETKNLFLESLSKTPIIGEEEEYRRVEDAAHRSLGLTGQLVAVSFAPKLQKLSLTAESLDSVRFSFVSSWLDHMTSSLPGVATYAPFLNRHYQDQKTIVNENDIHSFLLSPRIFGNFLNRLIQSSDFNIIASSPFEKLQLMKNGDWNRFMTAYHEAVASVSKEISFISKDHSFSPNDLEVWVNKVFSATQGKSVDYDVSSFLESSVSFTSVFLDLGLLRFAYKIFDSLVSKRINNASNQWINSMRSATSPFIVKLNSHYGLSGMRA